MSEKKPEGKEAVAKQKEEKHPAPKLVKHESNKPHHSKVSRMDLSAVQHAIDETQKRMGGLTSRHGQFLVAHKEFLLKQAAMQNYRKVA